MGSDYIIIGQAVKRRRIPPSYIRPYDGGFGVFASKPPKLDLLKVNSARLSIDQRKRDWTCEVERI
jgi:hypothetical protein